MLQYKAAIIMCVIYFFVYCFFIGATKGCSHDGFFYLACRAFDLRVPFVNTKSLQEQIDRDDCDLVSLQKKIESSKSRKKKISRYPYVSITNYTTGIYQVYDNI